MSDQNVSAFTGNLVRDAEVKEFDNGGAVINMDIAVNGRPYTKNGEKVEPTSFIPLKRFLGKESSRGIIPYLKKGTKIAVNGEIEQESWETDEGRRSKLVLKVFNLNLIGGGGGKGGSKSGGGAEPTSPDDMPF